MGTDKFKAYTVVSIQMISNLVILVTGWPFAGYVPLLIVQISGVILGIWAIVLMGGKNTNSAPLVKQDSHLVINGPYAFIRHPIGIADRLAADHRSIFSFAPDDRPYAND